MTIVVFDNNEVCECDDEVSSIPCIVCATSLTLSCLSTEFQLDKRPSHTSFLAADVQLTSSPCR